VGDGQDRPVRAARLGRTMAYAECLAIRHGLHLIRRRSSIATEEIALSQGHSLAGVLLRALMIRPVVVVPGRDAGIGCKFVIFPTGT
jgi:hypothetical protein